MAFEIQQRQQLEELAERVFQVPSRQPVLAHISVVVEHKRGGGDPFGSTARRRKNARE